MKYLFSMMLAFVLYSAAGEQGIAAAASNGESAVVLVEKIEAAVDERDAFQISDYSEDPIGHLRTHVFVLETPCHIPLVQFVYEQADILPPLKPPSILFSV